MLAVAALALTSLSGASLPPLPSLAAPVDLNEYAGHWYVHGAIPLRIPLFSDAEASNYIEQYELISKDTIRMTSAFDTPNDKRRSFSFKGKVVGESRNATWSIGLIWPLRAKYSIIYLDDDYTTTVVASPKRNNAWIMSRDPHMSEAKYAEMLEFMAAAGFDPTKFRKVPQDPLFAANLQADLARNQ